MAEQLTGLRRLAEELRGEISTAMRARTADQGVRVVAVTSGKGGVGKTNFSVNLALALVDMGQRVLLVDADLGLANVDLVLGTDSPHHLGHVLHGRCRLAEAVHEGPRGLRILSGGTALEELTSLPAEQIVDFLSQVPEVAGRGEIVILDTGAGLSGQVRAFLAAAPEVIVLTTPEPTAMADAYATIKVLVRENAAAHIYLVINQAQGREEAREAAGTLARVSLRYLGRVLHELDFIPRDPSVPRAVRERQPFIVAAPAAPASQAVRRVAASLLGRPPEPAAGLGGFFARFMRGLRGG